MTLKQAQLKSQKFTERKQRERRAHKALKKSERVEQTKQVAASRSFAALS